MRESDMQVVSLQRQAYVCNFAWVVKTRPFRHLSRVSPSPLARSADPCNFAWVVKTWLFRHLSRVSIPHPEPVCRPLYLCLGGQDMAVPSPFQGAAPHPEPVCRPFKPPR